jgi:hypothetical protein
VSSLPPDTRLQAPSVARALDDARARIIEAWDHHDRPQYLLCSPDLYQVVADSKRRETDAGAALRLLGLLVVREPALNNSDIEVR